LRTLFALVLGLFPVSGQVFKTLDLSATHDRQAFYVILASRGGSSTGHAFVVWGIEDDARKMSTVEALGLYPENDSDQCSTVVRTVSGRVMDEMVNHSVQSITYALIVRVDERDFQRSRKVARAWNCRHEFSLLSRDCVEFLRAVGVSLHLKMPARNVTRWTPQAYVRALQDRAGDGTLAVDWWWPATAGW
jgi:hypothetical protein